MEADAEARPLLELAAALDQRHGSDCPCARWHRHAVADTHVARDARVHAILDARCLTRDAVLGLQADHRIARNHEILERLWRLGSARRILCGAGRLVNARCRRGLGRRRRRRGSRRLGRGAGRPGARQRRRLIVARGRRSGAGGRPRGGRRRLDPFGGHGLLCGRRRFFRRFGNDRFRLLHGALRDRRDDRCGGCRRWRRGWRGRHCGRGRRYGVLPRRQVSARGGRCDTRHAERRDCESIRGHQKLLGLHMGQRQASYLTPIRRRSSKSMGNSSLSNQLMRGDCPFSMKVSWAESSRTGKKAGNPHASTGERVARPSPCARFC